VLDNVELTVGEGPAVEDAVSGRRVSSLSRYNKAAIANAGSRPSRIGWGDSQAALAGVLVSVTKTVGRPLVVDGSASTVLVTAAVSAFEKLEQ
jgi:hypothetical protein